MAAQKKEVRRFVLIPEDYKVGQLAGPGTCLDSSNSENVPEKHRIDLATRQKERIRFFERGIKKAISRMWLYKLRKKQPQRTVPSGSDRLFPGQEETKATAVLQTSSPMNFNESQKTQN